MNTSMIMAAASALCRDPRTCDAEHARLVLTAGYDSVSWPEEFSGQPTTASASVGGISVAIDSGDASE